MMRAFSRLMIVIAGSLALAACGGSAKLAPITDEDMAIGDVKAPVTVVEYASVACPGCAGFNNANWATLKKDYIDKGQVRWVVKEMSTHSEAWAAAGFLTARCLGKDKYFEAIDAFYQAQPTIDVQMRATNNPTEGLKAVAKKLGLSEDAFSKCVSDPTALEQFTKRVQRHAVDDKIGSTPTFMINGVEYAGDPMSLSEFTAALAAAKSKPPIAQAAK